MYVYTYVSTYIHTNNIYICTCTYHFYKQVPLPKLKVEAFCKIGSRMYIVMCPATANLLSSIFRFFFFCWGLALVFGGTALLGNINYLPPFFLPTSDLSFSLCVCVCVCGDPQPRTEPARRFSDHGATRTGGRTRAGAVRCGTGLRPPPPNVLYGVHTIRACACLVCTVSFCVCKYRGFGWSGLDWLDWILSN